MALNHGLFDYCSHPNMPIASANQCYWLTDQDGVNGRVATLSTHVRTAVLQAMTRLQHLELTW